MQSIKDGKRGKLALAEAAHEEAAWAISAMHQLHAQFLAANPVGIVAQGLAALGQAARLE